MPQLSNQSDKPDYSEAFKSLLLSPLGEELLRTLDEDLHNSIIQDAEFAESQEKAFGLLKQAAGVTLAVKHLRMRAVTPKDEGGKVN